MSLLWVVELPTNYHSMELLEEVDEGSYGLKWQALKYMTCKQFWNIKCTATVNHVCLWGWLGCFSLSSTKILHGHTKKMLRELQDRIVKIRPITTREAQTWSSFYFFWKFNGHFIRKKHIFQKLLHFHFPMLLIV